MGASVIEVKLIGGVESSRDPETGEMKARNMDAEETALKGMPYSIYFDVIDEQTAKTHGRKILSIIWQEFYDYLGKFDGRSLPQLNFDDGNVFIQGELIYSEQN